MSTETQAVQPVVKRQYDATSSLDDLMKGILVRCQPFYKAPLTVALEDGRAVLKGWPVSTDIIAWVKQGMGISVTYGVNDKFGLTEKIVGNEIDRFAKVTGAVFALKIAA